MCIDYKMNCIGAVLIHSQIRLIRVYIVCHSVYNFWTYFAMVKLNCLNFKIFTAVFGCSEYLGNVRYVELCRVTKIQNHSPIIVSDRLVFRILWNCSDILTFACVTFVELCRGWNDYLVIIYHHWCIMLPRGARWLSGRVSNSGARGRGFDTYRRRVVSLSKTLYSPKVLVNYPGSGGSVPTWLKICWLGRKASTQTNKASCCHQM